jgi:hypothetical protein
LDFQKKLNDFDMAPCFGKIPTPSRQAMPGKQKPMNGIIHGKSLRKANCQSVNVLTVLEDGKALHMIVGCDAPQTLEHFQPTDGHDPRAQVSFAEHSTSWRMGMENCSRIRNREVDGQMKGGFSAGLSIPTQDSAMTV